MADLCTIPTVLSVSLTFSYVIGSA